MLGCAIVEDICRRCTYLHLHPRVVTEFITSARGRSPYLMASLMSTLRNRLLHGKHLLLAGCVSKLAHYISCHPASNRLVSIYCCADSPAFSGLRRRVLEKLESYICSTKRKLFFSLPLSLSQRLVLMTFHISTRTCVMTGL